MRELFIFFFLFWGHIAGAAPRPPPPPRVGWHPLCFEILKNTLGVSSWYWPWESASGLRIFHTWSGAVRRCTARYCTVPFRTVSCCVDSVSLRPVNRTQLIWYSTKAVSSYSILVESSWHRARQLYKNISMLFLFPVKDGKLSTGVNATFNASCYS